jgi:hypothetical protein
MHKDFLMTYGDETWGIFSPEIINPNSRVSIQGYNLAQLQTDFPLLTSTTPPVNPPITITPTVAIANIKTIMATSSKTTKAKLISSINAIIAQTGG